MKKLIILFFVIIMTSCQLQDLEIPKYKVLEVKGNIEIREYEAMNIATVKTKGERKDSIKRGFRVVADYIFGNNELDKSIKMTAPVQQQTIDDSWEISFVMPSKYALNDLPKPNNELVLIKQIPQKKFVVIRFSGTNSNRNINNHKEKLLAYVKENNLVSIGSLKYAFYNPPWTIPFMKRNEIMLEIK